MSESRDLELLQLAVDLAAEALAAGDDPFGSVLADASGKILFQDRNRTFTHQDATYHPEFTIAQWAQKNLSPQQRRDAVVYTSGEHCAMCSAAHGWVGLGKIWFVSSSQQLAAWREEIMGKSQPKEGTVVKNIGIRDVLEGLQVHGPVEELDAKVKELHRKKWTGGQGA